MPRSSAYPTKQLLLVGASAQDVTPAGETFLYGYPNVPRIRTGIHDPLMASALVLHAGAEAVMFVSVDVIFLSKNLVRQARRLISQATGIATSRILISATHTHSGPPTIAMISNAGDPVVPPPDAGYLGELVSGIASAGIAAWQQREPAEVAQVTAVCPGLGGNRHDPAGPTIDTIPLLAARSVVDSSRMLAMMYVNRVHPTVLHEDSALISGDFPGFCRQHLQQQYFGAQCPVLCHLGAAGDQSPRHMVESNTLEEAERLGDLLADALLGATAEAEFTTDIEIQCVTSEVELPLRSLPSRSRSGWLSRRCARTLSTICGVECGQR
jgi:neutral ceramidase